MLQVLLNKIALSSFSFKSANALLFFQCALCMVLVLLCKAAKLVKVCRCMQGGKSGALWRGWCAKGQLQGAPTPACLCPPEARLALPGLQALVQL